jgi:hypothetical protein
MVQAFPFSGVMNLDDPDEVINPAHLKEVRNVQFKGTQPNLRAENVPGSVEIAGSPIIPVGVNKTIGKFYDAIGKRIFFFVYNSNNIHGVYVYNTLSSTYQTLVINPNSLSDILVFTASGTITSINIIYGDSTQGDILCWVDSVGRPSKININRALAGGYGTFQKSYLDVAKEPADIPPYVVYERDTSSTINNLRKKLFRVKVRWVFDDQDKAVTSSQSEMPLPYNAFDQAIDTDPTYNCRLAITYQTGPPNVKKIEILASNSIGALMSDFYLIASIDKAVDNIPSNDVATYLFYNDKGYTYIDINESNQIFDYVPIACGAQALLNGNVLSYGNITEGYPNLTNFSDGTNTSYITSEAVPYYYGNYYANLIGNQGGNSGFGTGNIHVVVRGFIISLPFSLDTYYVYFTDGTNIHYTLLSGDDAADIIEGLRVDALSKGFTIVSTGANDLYIFKTGVVLARTELSTADNFSYNSIFNTSFNAYDWSSKYGFGLVYFDQKGRTNGTVYTNGFSVQSIPYGEATAVTDTTLYFARIYHRPPDWAYYYQWVRTNNLSKSSYGQWITDRTFKDTVALGGLIKYAYLSIQSLKTFVDSNPGSPLGYSYTAGDRVRFFKLYNDSGGTAVLYGSTKDFEIVASLTNPTINGEIKLGQFIKIVLPSTDGSFDFGAGFNSYFIEFYTPALPVANNLNLYYEYGERYAIANPALSTRVHQGMVANQVYLSQPATFRFFKGDAYVRLRAIQTGNVYLYTLPQGSLTNTNYFLFGMNFISSTYNTTGVETQSVALAPLTGPFNPSGDGRWFLKSTPNTTFKVEGSISINFTDSAPGDSWQFYIRDIYGDYYILVPYFDAGNAGTYTFNVSAGFTLEIDRAYLLGISSSFGSITAFHRDIVINTTNLTFTIDRVINQRMIDPNFSDYYLSKVNSSGRAFVYDSNANQVTYPDMYRWSLAYQRNTNINQSNRFYPANYDEVDRSWGAIKRMMVWENVLTFFQERKCAWTGIYQKFVSDVNGNNQLVTTDAIITSNNKQYYAGNYGVGNQPDSVVQSGFVYYFADPIKGEQCRLSRDGITQLSELYKTKTWAGNNLTPYLNNYTYQYGGNARITGVFNVRKDNVGEYICILQGGTSGSGTVPKQSIAFDETKNCFTSFYDYAPDCMVCAENILYAFNNGKLYRMNGLTKNTFFGQYFDPTITRVFNQSLIEKKTFESLTEVSNVIWDCPDIYTNQVSYGTTAQSSNLITQDFVRLESTFNAAFMGDINSIGGIANGDQLKGNFIVIKFRAQNATTLVHFSAVLLYFIDSPYTNR